MTQLPRTYTIVLPYTRPPLRPNDRHHWTQKARTTRQMRLTAHLLAANAHIPPLGRATIETVWYPPDRRRRDANSLVLLTKASVDGLVDAGIWPDDDPAHVAAETYRIGATDPDNPRIELTITEETEEPS